MSSNAANVIMAVVGALAFAAIALAVVYGVHEAQVLGTQVKLTCIEMGGTWVNYNDLCIASGMAVQK